jgi:hypothetical protein
VPQGVDAADLGDAGGGPGEVVITLAAGAVDGARRVRARRKQPVRGLGPSAAVAPVQPQVVEQLSSQQRIAVLSALALDDADAHAVGGGVDVAATQPAQLAQAQATGIGQGQEHPGLGRDRCGQQRGHLGARQHFRQPLRIAAHGDLRSTLILAQHIANQEAQGARSDVDGGARPLSLLQQEQQVSLNLLIGQQRGAAVVMLGRLPDGGQVGLLGARSKAAQHHRIDHALAQWCHQSLRGPGKSPQNQGTTHRPTQLTAHHHRVSGLVQRPL